LKPRLWHLVAFLAGAAGWLACSPGDTPHSEGDAALEAGRELALRAEFDSARAILDPTIERARQTRDSLLEARGLAVLARTSYWEGDYAEAQRLYEAALAIQLAANAQEELARSYYGLGLIAWQRGRLTEAIGHHTKAAEAARAVGDRAALASAVINLGLVQTDLGEFEAARTGYAEARELSRALGNARLEGIALNNLGMLDVWVGNPERAVPNLLEARRLYRSVDYTLGEQNALGQLGTAYAALGEPSLAIAALDSALAQTRELGLRQEEASNLEELAKIHRDAGNHERALQLFSDARAINEEIGLTVEMGADLRYAAEIYSWLGNTELARSHVAQALTIHQGAGARFHELSDIVLLAELDAELGNASRASVHMTAARRLAGELEARVAHVEVALAEARIADKAGDAGSVLRALDDAEQALRRGGYDTEWEAEALRARALARLGRLDSAVAAGRRAVAAVERVRGGFGSGSLRTRYLADRARAYADLVTVLHQLGLIQEAFEVTDAIRGRVLLEQLAAVTDDGVARGKPTDNLVESERLLRRIGALVTQLDLLEEVSPEERDSALVGEIERIQRLLGAARIEYEALVVRAVELGGPRTALLGHHSIRADDVQQALRADEALLEYLVTSEQLILFVVTPTELHMSTVPVTERSLAHRVRLARDLLDDPKPAPDGLRGVLRPLHGVLLEPVLRGNVIDGTKRVFIVPHGVLTYLPFAALQDGTTGRYFAEDYVLTNLPSARALPLLRQPEQRVGSQLDGELRATVFAPLPEDLPATEVEAEAVRDALDGGRSHVGRRATEGRLRSALADDQIVHVATHGILNARSPMFSRVELAGGRRSQSDDDGRLEVHEILGLSIRSPLVFLSGCETGLGVAWSTGFVRGEDYTTLAQALLYAGAPNVVATLWRIDDAGAAVFAKGFYNALKSAEPATALAQAQRSMMLHERYSSPYYWAAYQLAGQGSR
jgi:CHAT domain-containing protein